MVVSAGSQIRNQLKSNVILAATMLTISKIISLFNFNTMKIERLFELKLIKVSVGHEMAHESLDMDDRERHLESTSMKTHLKWIDYIFLSLPK